jgi:hypothetical protein
MMELPSSGGEGWLTGSQRMVRLGAGGSPIESHAWSAAPASVSGTTLVGRAGSTVLLVDRAVRADGAGAPPAAPGGR